MAISEIQNTLRSTLDQRKSHDTEVMLLGKKISHQSAAQLCECKLQFDKLKKLTSVRKEVFNSSNPQIQRGTLLHGSSYSRELVSSIFSDGIVSGELLENPIQEQDETHFHADFFRVPDHTQLASYIKKYSTAEKLPGSLLKKSPMEKKYLPFHSHMSSSDRIAFIVSPNSHLTELQQFDPYHGTKELAGLCKLPYEKQSAEALRLSSIPVGIPPIFITGIIVSPNLQQNKEEINWLRECVPNDVAIFDTAGEIILA